MTELPPPIPDAPRKNSIGPGAIIGIIVAVVVVMVMCAGLLLGLLLPALGKARQSAQMLKSSAQMRMIAMSLQVYAMDNDNQYPEAGADLRTRLGTVVPPDSWEAPEAPAGMTSYYYVPLGDMTRIQDPARTVLLYENPALPKRTTWNVVFADGRADLLGGTQFRQLIDALTLPDGTPYAPHK